jgi:hypothetical protein
MGRAGWNVNTASIHEKLKIWLIVRLPANLRSDGAHSPAPAEVITLNGLPRLPALVRREGTGRALEGRPRAIRYVRPSISHHSFVIRTRVKPVVR